jgi:FAD/FMN-containing dehydrogenase/Fe-S oxidoreductase
MARAELPLIGQSGEGRPVPDLGKLRAELAEAITGEVRFDRISRALYSTDASVYQIVPLGVVLPKTAEDVVATLKACARSDIPLTARGAGTSQAGQAIGPGLVLDFSKYMDRILQINAIERWVRVQPGCVLDDLNLALGPSGLHFAPDVSTSNRATIGGMIANNSSGAHSIVYGKTVDHVMELTVVLADGSIVQLGPLSDKNVEGKYGQDNLEGACYRTTRRLASEHTEEIERRYPKILRRVGGYNLDLFVRSTQGADALRSEGAFNLARLLVGSEGTLGITVEAKLRLVELPRAKALVVVQFGDLLDALAATPAILPHRPSAIEVVDKYVLDSTRLNAEASRLRDFLQGDPGAILIVEFFGSEANDLPERVDALVADLKRQSFGDCFHMETDPAGQERIWKLRRMALGLSMAQKGDAKALSFVEDTAVSPEHLRDYIAEFLAIVRKHGTTAGVYAHASVGCLHVRPVIDLKTEVGVRQFEAIANDIADLVLKYNGSLSGEHGDGLVRSPFQERLFGPALYQAFRELKRTFDPQNLLNPGKIVDAPPLTSNLRYGPAYLTPEIATTFDFTVDGGMARAAELCSGVGACRKKREGSMCPSYRATRDEQHSTRGRANALRLAMTGQVGIDGLADPAMYEVLDLCLECKACKSECPTNVDMARLKAEFLHHFYKQHGLPLRNRIFGNVAELACWGSRLTPFSNWLARSAPARWANEKLLGIDRRRVPPKFAHTSFLQEAERWWQKQPPKKAISPVLVFPDTFTNYFEPEVGIALMEVLDRIGYAAIPCPSPTYQCPAGLEEYLPPRLLCCGRPFISNGLLDKAVNHARHNVEQLYPALSKGQVLIGCEPSCILTIKDDYPALVSGDLRRKAEEVAARCFIFEEFVEHSFARSPDLPPLFNAVKAPRNILLHGHCHERALVGLGPSLSLLRRIPGANVVDLDAGCCGMAGSFGYETKHYEVSRLVGEQRLFPAVRAATPEAVIVASGFSCRAQIRHFTGRTALHPAQFLQQLLRSTRE